MATPRRRRPHVTEGDTSGKPCRKSLRFQGDDVPQVEETQETRVEKVERTKPIELGKRHNCFNWFTVFFFVFFLTLYSDIFKYVQFFILCVLPNVI